MNRLVIVLTVLLSGACTQKETQEAPEEIIIVDYDDFEEGLDARVANLMAYPVDSTAFPRSREEDGEVLGVHSRDWTSGFLPGSLFYLYRLTKDSAFLNQGLDWSTHVEKEKWNGGTHDMGFKIYCSIGNAYEITGDPKFKDIIIQSAKTLSTRFDSTIGCIKSWDFIVNNWRFPVIIDNMMNLELLFEATRLSGDSSFYQMAESHALKTMENHFRPDHSSYHVLDYSRESGEVTDKLTHQGYDDESIWSRGQTWGLYGFTMAYRYTNQEAFLDQAIHIASFIMNQPVLPRDKIPYWDMKDPAIPNAPRDASAAAIAASASYELFSFTNDSIYLNFADDIMKSLSSSDYTLSSSESGPFILDHSTGNWPKNDEIDVPINYADYYFLEALYRQRNMKF